MPTKPFSLDEALSSQPKKLGSLDWVSASFATVTSLGAYSADKTLAIAQTSIPHGLKEGDRVILAGFEFGIDKQYEVIDHPSPGHQAKAFAIAKPEELGDRTLQNGTAHKRKSWSVYAAKHLHLEGTTELKQLQLDQMANRQAQMKYEGMAAIFEIFKAEVATLAKKHKIADVEKFAKAIAELASKEGDELDKETTILKKTYSITGKGFDKAISEISEKIRESYVDVAQEMSRLGDDVMKEFENRRYELLKREIEIMCVMPNGTMSILDNLSGADNLLANAYIQVSGLLAPPKGSEGNGQEAIAQNSP